ncbi:hypothetical protein RJ639_011074 [Escallonia herrerae]|uniref:Retrotransposon gag domain-containing protein n=1 Tax=Escallonia herrerae TaxID=1293975 RepID=A0AA88VKS6_9ASTE|nr:hypothetical protein RJ639_011074 [Escallonia herrerae]
MRSSHRLSHDQHSTPSRRRAGSAEDAYVNVTSATPESEIRPRRNRSLTSTLKNEDLGHCLNCQLFKTPHANLTKEIHELKYVVNTLQQKLDMAVAPPSTHHSNLDPSDLRLRLTSRSSYDRKYRTGDPGKHVYQFETNMLLLQVSDVVMYRAFLTTLRKAAHAWFKSLQPRSVYFFGQLSDLFQKHFVSSRSRRKNLASLLNIVQEKNESLACFLGRFNTATLEIDNFDESVKYNAFLRGLRSTSKFAFSVNKSPPGNMKAFLKKGNKYIQAEEYLETHKGRWGEEKEEQKK